MPDDHVAPSRPHEAGDASRLAQSILAEAFALPEAAIFGPDLTLAALLAASPQLANSVDLMEAFAKAANALRKRYGVPVRLSAFSLDTPISVVTRSMVTQVAGTAHAART
jgi:hypothetical protein